MCGFINVWLLLVDVVLLWLSGLCFLLAVRVVCCCVCNVFFFCGVVGVCRGVVCCVSVCARCVGLVLVVRVLIDVVCFVFCYVWLLCVVS